MIAIFILFVCSTYCVLALCAAAAPPTHNPELTRWMDFHQVLR